MSKRIEQLYAFVTREVFALQQANDLVAKQFLPSDGIDVRDRDPFSVGVANPTRGEAVSMRMWIENTSKRLRDHNRVDEASPVAVFFSNRSSQMALTSP